MQPDVRMNRDVRICFDTDKLDVPARYLWEGDIESVVVVDSKGVPTGSIDPWDICVAACRAGRPLAQIDVASAMGVSAARLAVASE